MSSRLQSVDVYRGFAIVVMAAYHLLWDLNFEGVISVGIGVDPLWIGFQRSIVTAFLLLVGGSLWLAHRDGISWRGFWKREALLVAAAIGVSVVTWLQFGEYFSYFGILHAIALFSLMALPFIGAPLWVGGVTAATFLFLPLLNSPAFNPRGLSWIGFFNEVPMTADLVPVFPWFGVVLIGVLGMRLLQDTGLFVWRSENVVLRGVAQAGRWSLWIYLVHQPILFAVIGWLLSFRA